MAVPAGPHLSVKGTGEGNLPGRGVLQPQKPGHLVGSPGKPARGLGEPAGGGVLLKMLTDGPGCWDVEQGGGGAGGCQRKGVGVWPGQP